MRKDLKAILLSILTFIIMYFILYLLENNTDVDKNILYFICGLLLFAFVFVVIRLLID